MKKILIPTDFSENAWASLVYAVKLFEKVDCTFYLLHTTILNSTSITGYSTDKLNKEKEKSIKELDDLKQEAENINLNTNHTFQTVLSYYHLDQAINFTVEKHNIDLTIIGTKGATNTKEKFLGSNTTRVLKNIKSCPTILVPDEYYFEGIDEIALLTDLKHTMDSTLLNPLKELLESNNSRTTILRISSIDNLSEEEEVELNSIQSILTPHKTEYKGIGYSFYKDEVINKFIEINSIDMLVLTYYKQSFLSKLFNNQSLTTTISQNPIIPMLILPNKK